MTSTTKAVSMKAAGQLVSAVPPRSDELEREEECTNWEQNGLRSPENSKRSRLSIFSFALAKSKTSECMNTYSGGKTTATSRMKIIGTTRNPSNERAAMSRSITKKSQSQSDRSKQTGKANNYSNEKQQTTEGKPPSAGEMKKASSDSKRENKRTDRRHPSKRSTEKPVNHKKTSATYEKINPIVDSNDSKTADRGIHIIRCTSTTSSVGEFTQWERTATSPLELFFAKSNKEMLAPKVLFDEESFYEGSFDEEFLSEDNEKLERCRILEERFSSRLQRAVDQDAAGSVVSLDGINIFDLPDDEIDNNTSSPTRNDGLMSKQSTQPESSDKTVSTSQRRFDFEKAKPMFVSPWKMRHVESKTNNSADEVEATQEARMSSLRKLFRRKSRTENQRSKKKTSSKATGSLSEEARSCPHPSSDLAVKIIIETRNEEAIRSERRDMEIPEDRDEEEEEWESEYEFMDEFPFDSCYFLSCQ